jgi:hypothetical protein
MQSHPHSRAGSTLLLASVLLTAAAVITVSVIRGQEGGDVNKKTAASVNKLDKVD